ncbi:hypothetical protein O3M35_012806 [Rhynocoris fuscipes]|uniref:Uncharacterized protein n=1 Tax=Rhynocoris fuscipes TaxID=488301 RepID=A0AAW1CFS5_9HEMI
MDLDLYDSDEFDNSDIEDENYEHTRTQNSTTDHGIPLGQKLINAILERKVDIAELLLKDGADSNYNASNSCWSPLMHAASLGAVELIKLLLDCGADPTYELNKKSAVMCLCESCCFDENQLLECLNILVANGADINAKDNHGLTPLMMAVKRGHSKLVARLIEFGSNIEHSTADGCNLSLMDKHCRTLHDLASENNFQEIIEILSEETIVKSDQNSYKLSNYESVMSEISDATLSGYKGFFEDTLKTIDGVGLGHLTPLFMEKKIGFGEFLISTDKDWKTVGVQYSFDRKKLIYYAYSIIKRHWSRNCIIDLENHELNLFWIAKIMSNNIRIMHIIRATLHVCSRELNNNNNFHIDFSKKQRIHANLIDCCEKVNLLSNSLKQLSSAVEKIADRENIVSVDFINNQKYFTRSNFYIYFYLSLFIGFNYFVF